MTTKNDSVQSSEWLDEALHLYLITAKMRKEGDYWNDPAFKKVKQAIEEALVEARRDEINHFAKLNLYTSASVGKANKRKNNLVEQRLSELDSTRKQTEEGDSYVDCPQCGGQGWTTEHDTPSSHHDGECHSCPVQAPCEFCRGTGKIDYKRAATRKQTGGEK